MITLEMTLSEEERRKILIEWDQTQADYPLYIYISIYCTKACISQRMLYLLSGTRY